jgi:hypothetical protein
VGLGGLAGLSNPRGLLGKGPLNRGAKLPRGCQHCEISWWKGEIRQLRTGLRRLRGSCDEAVFAEKHFLGVALMLLVAKSRSWWRMRREWLESRTLRLVREGLVEERSAEEGRRVVGRSQGRGRARKEVGENSVISRKVSGRARIEEKMFYPRAVVFGGVEIATTREVWWWWRFWDELSRPPVM